MHRVTTALLLLALHLLRTQAHSHPHFAHRLLPRWHGQAHDPATDAVPFEQASAGAGGVMTVTMTMPAATVTMTATQIQMQTQTETQMQTVLQTQVQTQTVTVSGSGGDGRWKPELIRVVTRSLCPLCRRTHSHSKLRSLFRPRARLLRSAQPVLRKRLLLLNRLWHHRSHHFHCQRARVLRPRHRQPVQRLPLR